MAVVALPTRGTGVAAASPVATVIVATYERPGHLERCLEGFRFQTRRDFEIIVTDDGSGAETAETVVRAAQRLLQPVRHLWQEDRGFRKCRALNAAVRAARARYLIFTDGDCVPHRRFVESHLRFRRPHRFLVGRAVKWSARRSEGIDLAAVARGRHARLGWRDLLDALRGANRHASYGIPMPGELGFQLIQRLKRSRAARGANLSLWREDLEEINGWNEDFEGWGLEDAELGMRLRYAGVEPMLVVGVARTFHLHHPVREKGDPSARRAYDASKALGAARCPNGLIHERRPSAAGSR